MGLTYSNKAKGHKHTRKNNDTEQLENNKKSTQLEHVDLELYKNKIKSFTYLSPADGRGVSSAFS